MSKHTSVGWAFWLWWVLASTLGWAMGFAVAAVVLWTIGSAGAVHSSLAPVVVFAVGGGVAGIMQWFLLRRHIPQAGWWVLASALGGALAGSVSDVGIPPVSFAVVGTVAGIMQWFVLRRCIPQAGWWVVASTVGWAVGFPVVDAVSSPVRQAVNASAIPLVSEMVSDIVHIAVLFGMMGGVPAVITGIALTWLMAKSNRKACHPNTSPIA